MGAKWMERLLQGFLYDDNDSYLCDKVYREMLIDQLKSQGLIEKKKVILTKSAAVEKAADQFPRQKQTASGISYFRSTIRWAAPCAF